MINRRKKLVDRNIPRNDTNDRISMQAMLIYILHFQEGRAKCEHDEVRNGSY